MDRYELHGMAGPLRSSRRSRRIQYLLPKIEHVTLCIYTEQNGSSVSKQFNAKPKKLNDADRISLVLDQLLGLFFIACGAILVWQAPNAASWGFFLYALWYNPGQNYVLYALLQQSPWIAFTQEIMQGTAEAAGLCGLYRFRTAFSQKLRRRSLAAEYRTRSATPYAAAHRFKSV